MRCSLWSREKFFTVGTLDVLFKIILICCLFTRELLLSSKYFASSLGVNIEDLYVVEVSRLLSDTSTWLLLALLYHKDNVTQKLVYQFNNLRYCNVITYECY